MLSFMQGNDAVGLYNAAYRIVLLLLFIPTVINSAISPVMSRLYVSSHNSLEKIVEKYFNFYAINWYTTWCCYNYFSQSDYYFNLWKILH